MGVLGKEKELYDVIAWFGNVSSSVLLIYSNKVLMSGSVGYGFRFGKALRALAYFKERGESLISLSVTVAATTLCALHYLTCTLGTVLLKRLGYIKKTSISYRGR